MADGSAPPPGVPGFTLISKTQGFPDTSVAGSDFVEYHGTRMPLSDDSGVTCRIVDFPPLPPNAPDEINFVGNSWPKRNLMADSTTKDASHAEQRYWCGIVRQYHLFIGQRRSKRCWCWRCRCAARNESCESLSDYPFDYIGSIRHLDLGSKEMSMTKH